MSVQNRHGQTLSVTSSPADFREFHFEAFYKMAEEKGGDYTDNVINSVLVDYARECMREKLKLARNKGQYGWWFKDECEIDLLKERLSLCVEKGDMVDVMNYAAMVHARECGEWMEVQNDTK